MPGIKLSIGGVLTGIQYDAENRMVQITGQSGAVWQYVYHGEGRRVEKTSGGATTRYVYDAEGNLAAEYGVPTGTPGATFPAEDHLGSIRGVLNSFGTYDECDDYLPFGQLIGANFNRTANCFTGHGDGDTPMKFTSKERDAESGLDYFGYRYFSSAQGRWTSPDQPFADQHPEDPQSWNMYGCVRNNPLKNTDSNGKECQSLSSCGNTLLGTLGQLANTVSSDVINAPNRLANLVIAPFTSFRFADIVPAAFTPANADQQEGVAALTNTLLAAPVGAGLTQLGTTMGTATEVTTVVHYTSDAGVAGITESGGVLRSGTYVTTPGEIPAGASSGTVEQLLEIGPGKGTNSVTFQTPSSNLVTPTNGSTTSGGAVQFQLKNPTQVNPGEFKPTTPPSKPPCVPGQTCGN